MRRLFCIFILFFTTAAFGQTAQGAPEADTFLYRVSKTGRPVSYLLGTIHVGKLKAALPADYRRTLARVSQLVVESDEESLSRTDQAAMLLMMADSRTLNTSLGAARAGRLINIVQQGQETIAFTPESKVKPWAFWLSAQSLFNPKGYSYQYGIDNLLMQAAKAQGKAVLPLEGIEQLSYFTRLPEPAVIRALDSFAQRHREFLAETIDLERDYRHQHAKKVWHDISNPDHQLKFLPQQDRALWHDFMYNKLLTERNQKWLPRLIEILPHKPTLVAVGSAHLFGTQGLIARLRQVGYQVEPVKVGVK